MGNITERITSKALKFIRGFVIYQKRNKNHWNDREVIF